MRWNSRLTQLIIVFDFEQLGAGQWRDSRIEKSIDTHIIIAKGVSTSAGIPDFRSPETGMYLPAHCSQYTF